MMHFFWEKSASMHYGALGVPCVTVLRVKHFFDAKNYEAQNVQLNSDVPVVLIK